MGAVGLAAKIFMPKFFLLRLIPYALIIPIILFEALSLSGCVSTSPAIPSLYIVSLRSSQNTTLLSQVQVRLGYFGICGGDGSTFHCQSSMGTSTDLLAANLFPDINLNINGSYAAPPLTSRADSDNATADAREAGLIVDLVSTAVDLQTQVYVSVLAAAAFFFVIGLVFLLLHKLDIKKGNSDKPRRSAIIKRGTFGMLMLSTGLVFTAALATTETAGVLKHSTEAIKNTPVLMKEGITLQVMQWMAFGFSMLFTLAAPLLARPGLAPFNKAQL
ncbi:Ca2+ regulator and membrane fusion protein Fig1-domain-containing protein [Apodospora peruviana]|uniref:Ca2+ regulator and membrane fusion protein Fig1-domain-containing protein n=1 Tax=Apodospora peruviana TaxID=516989 RepID=A0AAE0IIW4_9PEZI|nr:Ca2+ regulator and membrane fusion protein Fig1-domain-containing protein [Apodospora peruviana]